MSRRFPIGLARKALLGVVLWLSTSACTVRPSEVPAYPLYPNPERHLDVSQVAKLLAATNVPMSGALLKSVDDKGLPAQEAEVYELLPGCHVVQTTNQLTLASDHVTWAGNIGSMVFPLRMKPGRTYVVRFSLVEGMGGDARVSMRAEEQDSSGATTATFDPATSVEEVKTCLAWHSDELAPP